MQEENVDSPGHRMRESIHSETPRGRPRSRRAVTTCSGRNVHITGVAWHRPLTLNIQPNGPPSEGHTARRAAECWRRGSRGACSQDRPGVHTTGSQGPRARPTSDLHVQLHPFRGCDRTRTVAPAPVKARREVVAPPFSMPSVRRGAVSECAFSLWERETCV